MIIRNPWEANLLNFQLLMNQELPSKSSESQIIATGKSFAKWSPLNDTIMGGSSEANCRLNSIGLVLEGELIEEGGGFISCRSEVFNPPLNLAKYQGLQLELEGEGRILKLAIACEGEFLRSENWFSEGLRWVADVPTRDSGRTRVNVPFNNLRPTVQAKSIPIPLEFDSSQIIQFQLLHSKFGESGSLNPGFRSGSIRILLRSISGFF